MSLVNNIQLWGLILVKTAEIEKHMGDEFFQIQFF